MQPPKMKYQILNSDDAARIKEAVTPSRHPKDVVLEAFQRRVFEYFTGYTFAMNGMSMVVDSMPEPINPSQNVFIGVGPPEKGVALARLNYVDVRRDAAEDGAYLDRIAKALLVLVYAEWDEVTRPQMALSYGTESKLIRSDLMGDLRLIRNWIVHNKSVVDKRVSGLKVLEWELEVGQTIVITKLRMQQFMQEMNQMLVEIQF